MHKIEFSDDIKEILANRFNDVNIYSLDLKSLKELREQVENLREEYALIENAYKVLSNAAYGASAANSFYFYNLALAGDITGECRVLTQFMWNELEKFMKEDLWQRKDLWEKFDFALDESKHNWYREQPVSCYSDTDSTSGSSKIIIMQKDGTICTKTIAQFFKDNYQKFFCFSMNAQSGHEYIVSDDKILNWTSEKGLHFVSVKYIMKHNVSKSRFRIKTKSGKEIIVTGDHSCIVFRDGKQMEIKAKDININTDKILSIDINK